MSFRKISENFPEILIKFSKFPWKFGGKFGNFFENSGIFSKIREGFPKIVAIFNQSIISNQIQSINQSISFNQIQSIDQSIVFNQIHSIAQSFSIKYNQFQLNAIYYNENTNKFHEIQSNTIEFVKKYPNTVRFDHVQ
jgi:hypothetical protein